MGETRFAEMRNPPAVLLAECRHVTDRTQCADPSTSGRSHRMASRPLVRTRGQQFQRRPGRALFAPLPLADQLDRDIEMASQHGLTDAFALAQRECCLITPPPRSASIRPRSAQSMASHGAASPFRSFRTNRPKARVVRIRTCLSWVNPIIVLPCWEYFKLVVEGTLETYHSPSLPSSTNACRWATSSMWTCSRSTVTPSGLSLASARDRLSGFMPSRLAISAFS